MKLDEITQEVVTGETSAAIAMKALQELIRQGKLSPSEAQRPLEVLGEIEASEVPLSALKKKLPESQMNTSVLAAMLNVSWQDLSARHIRQAWRDKIITAGQKKRFISELENWPC